MVSIATGMKWCDGVNAEYLALLRVSATAAAAPATSKVARHSLLVHTFFSGFVLIRFSSLMATDFFWFHFSPARSRFAPLLLV